MEERKFIRAVPMHVLIKMRKRGDIATMTQGIKIDNVGSLSILFLNFI